MSTRLPAAERKRQLLEHAIVLFSARGFHAASMHDIAMHAGVTKPVIYRHFGSKRALHLAALHDVGDRLRQSIEKATAEAATPRAQVLAGLTAYFGFVDEHAAAFSLLFGGGSRRDPEFNQAAEAVEAAIAGSIAELIAVPELNDAVRALFGRAIVGLAEGACRHWVANGRTISSGEVAAHVSQLAWAGLRSVGPSTDAGESTPGQ